jgi:hypothetical protein
MLNSLVVLTAFVCGGGQDRPLEIANPRATYGYLGATRPKEGRLPGDVVFFTFDIKNMAQDDAGRASYSMLVEVTDSKGASVFKLGPTNSVAQNYLGGNSLPASAHLEIPIDAKPGEYNFKLTVTDRTTKKSAVLESKASIAPLDFGLVQIGTSADREGRVPVPPVGVVGGTIYYNFSAVGFGRMDSKQPDVHVTMRILDEQGKATFAKPLSGVVNKDVPEDQKIMPMQFGVTLNRTGTFTVELEATCVVCKKTTKVSMPLKVVSSN